MAGLFDSRILGSWTNISYMNKLITREQTMVEGTSGLTRQLGIQTEVPGPLLDIFSYKISELLHKEQPLWNPQPVESPSHPRRNSFSPVFQGVDKEKPIQAFFPIIYLGIFLPVYQGQFTGPTNPWFQPGFFSLCHNKEFFSPVFQGVDKEKPHQAFSPFST